MFNKIERGIKRVWRSSFIYKHIVYNIEYLLCLIVIVKEVIRDEGVDYVKNYIDNYLKQKRILDKDETIFCIDVLLGVILFILYVAGLVGIEIMLWKA
jgi:hypothetical protein